MTGVKTRTLQPLIKHKREILPFFRDIHLAYQFNLESQLLFLGLQFDASLFAEGMQSVVKSMMEDTSELEQYYITVRVNEPGIDTTLKILQKWAQEKKNTIAFVGYQAEGTLGKRIQKGWAEIPLNVGGSVVNIKMKMSVETCDGFSGHSDRRQLLNFVNNMSPRPEKIIFGHGEESKCIDISSAVHKRYNINTAALNNLETIRFR